MNVRRWRPREIPHLRMGRALRVTREHRMMRRAFNNQVCVFPTVVLATYNVPTGEITDTRAIPPEHTMTENDVQDVPPILPAMQMPPAPDGVSRNVTAERLPVDDFPCCTPGPNPVHALLKRLEWLVLTVSTTLRLDTDDIRLLLDHIRQQDGVIAELVKQRDQARTEAGEWQIKGLTIAAALVPILLDEEIGARAREITTGRDAAWTQGIITTFTQTKDALATGFNLFEAATALVAALEGGQTDG